MKLSPGEKGFLHVFVLGVKLYYIKLIFLPAFALRGDAPG